MELKEAYAEAARDVRAGASWSPGAWTPARCTLWHSMDTDMRDRLEKWIWAEGERGKCHASQLPVIEGCHG